MRKNWLLILCACLFMLPATAQGNVIEGDTVVSENAGKPEDLKSSVSLDGASYNFIFNWKKLPTKSHWTGFGFAFSNLQNLTGANLNLSRSYSVVLNLGSFIIPLHRNWLVTTGLGFDWSRYHFRGNTVLQEIGGATYFVPDRENREYRDSKLLVYYATLPLLMEYQTKINKRNSFFIYGGVEGLIKLYSKSQAEIKTPDGIKDVIYKDLNILPLNFRFALRTGFDDFSIFGYYQPCSIFEKDKGPDINPFGLGLMLNF